MEWEIPHGEGQGSGKNVSLILNLSPTLKLYLPDFQGISGEMIIIYMFDNYFPLSLASSIVT